MTWLAETAMLSYGWRRALLLVLAGALAGLSVPPLFILPALFVAMPIWVWCLDGAERQTGWRRWFGAAFQIGFAFGLGYFLVAIHWLGAAFFVDGGWVLVAMPFAILALAAVLAVFWGLASAWAFLFWGQGPTRIIALAASLTLMEFARGFIFTGFPFDLLGYALTANPQMMQLASIIGIYGLTAIAALIALLPALIWPADDRGLTRRLVPFFAIIVILTGQIAYGEYRLRVTQIEERTDLKLRLVQPAISQAQKWQTDSRDFIMERLISLSETEIGPNEDGILGVSQVIWPESAMPFFLIEEPDELARISRMLPLGKHLVTGAPRREFSAGTESAAFNSVMVINPDGEVISSYDKTHLVPFGEYLPFADLFARIGIKQFVPGNEGWDKGDSRRTLSAPGNPAFLPLVCYEVIFSGALGAALDDAEYILNLTNDGWFDGSMGLRQHFHHARLRAVEEGISLVRVANTGITALVDPLGQVRASTRPGEVAVLDVSPPRRLESTPFQSLQHWPTLLVLLLTFVGLTLAKRRTRNKAS